MARVLMFGRRRPGRRSAPFRLSHFKMQVSAVCCALSETRCVGQKKVATLQVLMAKVTRGRVILNRSTFV